MKKYPFKFLDYYHKEDFQFYYGRESEINSLHEMVYEARIILVYGPSGVGKTSLLQCGLANKFDSHEWMALMVERGTNINSSFESELEKAALGYRSYNTTIEKDNHNFSINEKLRYIYLSHFKPIYLIFDQFEELFIVGDKEEQIKFIRTIKTIITLPDPVHIIFCIREDYLAYLSDMELELPDLFSKRLRVQPMDFNRVERMLINVTHNESSLVKIESGYETSICNAICEKVSDNTNSQTVPLTYLQVYLDKLYKKETKDIDQKTDFTITHENLALTGKIGDVLSDFLEDCILELSRKFKYFDETDIWNLLSPFATIGGTKKAVSIIELSSRFPEIADIEIRLVVNFLQKKMLLRHKQEKDLYEVVHDAIAQKIAQKRGAEDIVLIELANLIKTHIALNGNSGAVLSENLLKFIDPFLNRLIDEKLVDETTLSIIGNSRLNLKIISLDNDKNGELKDVSKGKTFSLFLRFFKLLIQVRISSKS